MINVKNPQDLHDYAEGLARRFDDIAAFVYLDSGEEMDARLQGYFNNDYKGCVLMLGLYETDDTPNRRGLALSTLNAQLTLLDKVGFSDASKLIAARSRLWSLALRVMGRIELDYDDERGNDADPGQVSTEMAIVPQRNRQLLPITRPANVSAIGYAFDLDVRIPTNSLKYEDAD